MCFPFCLPLFRFWGVFVLGKQGHHALLFSFNFFTSSIERPEMAAISSNAYFPAASIRSAVSFMFSLRPSCKDSILISSIALHITAIPSLLSLKNLAVLLKCHSTYRMGLCRRSRASAFRWAFHQNQLDARRCPSCVYYTVAHETVSILWRRILHRRTPGNPNGATSSATKTAGLAAHRGGDRQKKMRPSPKKVPGAAFLCLLFWSHLL